MRPHEQLRCTGVALHSPSDLALLGDELYVAVSGLHQIWRVDLVTEQVSVLAGSGQLGLVDGGGERRDVSRSPARSACSGGIWSWPTRRPRAIRWVHVDEAASTTAIGTGLYEFGDSAGKRTESRACRIRSASRADPRGIVFIADSYNDAIKVLNRKSGELRALRINYRFHEPGGLSLAAGVLWVANTNLHEVMRIDLNSGRRSSRRSARP